MRDRNLRQQINNNEAALVCLHTQRQQRRKRVNTGPPNAFKDPKQLAEVDSRLLLRQRQCATPEANVVLDVVDLLKKSRTNRII